MRTDAFEKPQRQAISGVLLIFLSSLYRILRGFWVVAVYLVFQMPGAQTVLYILLAVVMVALLALAYSYLYYRRFLFHINYETREFILEKGVFSTDETAIPFDRIQQVYLKRNLLQRLINVYSVVVETAGSREEEVSISAISYEKANLLSSVLTKAKQRETEETAEETGEKSLWTHRLDIPALLKIGISSNYFRGFALILAFFTTVYNEFRTFFADHTEEISGYIGEVPGPGESVSVFLILLVLLLFMSIVITVIEVFIKYYNLKLEQTKDSLDLEMGLKTNTRVSLQPRRVQLMQISTNPVQRSLDLYEARISLASSENELQRNKIKIPGLQKEKLQKVKSFLYSEKEEREMNSFRPDKLLLFRGLTFFGIPLIISFLFLLVFPYISMSVWFILAAVYIVVFGGYQFLMFRSLKLEITPDFVRKKYGVWNQVEEQVENYKLQAVSVQQPIWYKGRKLVNLTLHTAGGDLSFRAVSEETLVYVNYLLFRIETVKKSWM